MHEHIHDGDNFSYFSFMFQMFLYVCMDGLEEILPQLYLEVWIISLIIDNH